MARPAQVVPAAELSVRMRSAVVSRADVRFTLEDGTLVKALAPRALSICCPADRPYGSGARALLRMRGWDNS